MTSDAFLSEIGSAGGCPGLLPPEASPCCVGGVNVADSGSMHSVTSSSWSERTGNKKKAEEFQSAQVTDELTGDKR